MNLLAVVAGHAELLRDAVTADHRDDVAAILDACDRTTHLARTWGRPS